MTRSIRASAEVTTTNGEGAARMAWRASILLAVVSVFPSAWALWPVREGKNQTRRPGGAPPFAGRPSPRKRRIISVNLSASLSVGATSMKGFRIRRMAIETR